MARLLGPIVILLGLMALVPALVPGLTSPALAQMPGLPMASPSASNDAPQDPEDTGEVHELVSRLSDAEVRERLLLELDEKAEFGEGDRQSWQQLVRSLLGTATLLAGHFSTVWHDTVNVFTDTGGTIAAYGSQTDRTLLEYWSVVIAAVLIGLMLEKGIRWAVPEPRPHAPLPPKERLSATLKISHHRLLLMTLSIGTTVLIGTWYFEAYSFDWRGFMLAMVAWMIIRISRWSSQFFQLPDVPEARLTPVSTYWARFMVRQTTVIAVIGGGAFLTYNFRVGVGLVEAAVTITFWFMVMLFAVVIYSIWRGRHAFSDMIMAGNADPTPAWATIAKSWPWVAMVLVFGEFLFIQYYAATDRAGDISIGGVFLTLMIILFLPPLLNAVVPLVAKLLPIHSLNDDIAKAKRLATRPPVEKIGRVGMLFLLLTILAGLWNISPLNLLSLRIGSDAVSVLVELFWLSVGTFLVVQIFDIWVGRMKAADEGLGGPEEVELGEMGGQGGTRLATVLPLFRKTGHSLILITFVLLALSELGVNIAPFIAGFGIIGLAVGFGAQTLVRDVVSGLFFLIDDAFRIGEYVDIGGTMGTVEKISARSLRLRHHRGPLHTVPYGEIAKLTNYSRDWVIVKLKFRVPFDTDINRVKKIFKQIGRDLLEHEELGPDFIQPFKSQGVFDVDDSAIIVRGKFMSKPGKQFLIKREVYVRVQRAFDENGIAFARRSVIVEVAGVDAEAENGGMTDAQRKAAISAAEQAIEEQQAQEASEGDDFAGADGTPGGIDDR
ncbi:MAG: mechanosensitive ion channel domain-containing protein [Pseudomonadota bacterium]